MWLPSSYPGCGAVIFLPQPGVDQLLVWVIQDFALFVQQVQVAGCAPVIAFADLFHAAKPHVDEQHALRGLAGMGQLDRAG